MQVKKEEYDDFFKQTFNEFLEPLSYAHFNVEGTIEFSAMLFVPGMAPFQQEVLCPLPLRSALHSELLLVCRHSSLTHGSDNDADLGALACRTSRASPRASSCLCGGCSLGTSLMRA